MRGQKCTLETENKDTMKLQGEKLKEEQTKSRPEIRQIWEE
jgi:hypothetical protein